MSIEAITHPPDRATKITELTRRLVRYRMGHPPDLPITDRVVDDWLTPFDIEFMLQLLRDAAPLYPLPEIEAGGSLGEVSCGRNGGTCQCISVDECMGER